MPREPWASEPLWGLRAGWSLHSLHPSLSPCIGAGAGTAGEERGLACSAGMSGKQEPGLSTPTEALSVGYNLVARKSHAGAGEGCLTLGVVRQS